MISAATRSKLYKSVLASAASPVMNLQSFRKVGDGRFSAVFASTETSHKFGFKDYDAVVAEITAERFGILANSLYTIDTAHVPMLRCILAANVESKPYDDTLAGFKAVHANVFSDSEDKLWRLVGEGDKRRLVQLSSDDYDAILAQRQQRNPVVASIASIGYEDGDYVLFYNPVQAEMDFGFALQKTDGDYVLARSNPTKLIRVLPDQIMEAASIGMVGEGQPGPRAWRHKTVASGSFSMQAYLDYMRSLFNGTAFMTALERAIRDNGVN